MVLEWIKMAIDVKYVVTFFVMLLSAGTMTLILSERIGENIANEQITEFVDEKQAEIVWLNNSNNNLLSGYATLSTELDKAQLRVADLEVMLKIQQDEEKRTKQQASIDAINYAWNQTAQIAASINATQQNLTVPKGYKCITLGGVRQCYKKSHSGGSGSGSAIVS